MQNDMVNHIGLIIRCRIPLLCWHTSNTLVTNTQPSLLIFIIVVQSYLLLHLSWSVAIYNPSWHIHRSFASSIQHHLSTYNQCHCPVPPRFTAQHTSSWILDWLLPTPINLRPYRLSNLYPQRSVYLSIRQIALWNYYGILYEHTNVVPSIGDYSNYRSIHQVFKHTINNLCIISHLFVISYCWYYYCQIIHIDT